MKHLKLKHPAILSVCAAAVLAALPAAAMAGDLFASTLAQKAEPQTDRMIVKYKDARVSAKSGAAVAAMSAGRMQILARSGQQFGLTMKALHSTGTGANVIQLSKKMDAADVEAVARDLQARDPNVEYAEADRRLYPMMTPNDPYFADQWHYGATGGGLRATTAWDTATGSGVVVAVIDTGVRPHVDLKDNLLPGYDMIADTFTANDGGGRDSDASDPGDASAAGACGSGSQARQSSWHGTHVAGTVAARTNNGIGVAGVAFNAKVVPVRVLGRCGGYTSDIADGIIWASGGTVTNAPANPNPAKVLNLSLGGSGSCSQTSQAAINLARSRGSIVVVAAGNSSTDASGFNPANCAGVVAVAAVNRAGGRASYSNYGSIIDVAAPGGETATRSSDGVLSTLNSGTSGPSGDSYSYYQGTSMAAPHVAGVAALMLSKTPGLTPDQIEAKLKSTARSFPASCSGCGSGIVDATAALGTVVDGGSVNETESNNTTATANAIASSATVAGTMASSTDTDYFSVQLPAGKTLSSTLTAAASTSDYELFVYNSAGTLIGSSENPAGSADSVSVTNTSTSTLTRYVRVVYYSGGTGATNGKYSLKLSW